MYEQKATLYERAEAKCKSGGQQCMKTTYSTVLLTRTTFALTNVYNHQICNLFTQYSTLLLQAAYIFA